MGGLLGESSTLANLGNDDAFIRKKYIFIGMRHFEETKSIVMRVYLKVDNIILLWRVVIPNTQLIQTFYHTVFLPHLSPTRN